MGRILYAVCIGSGTLCCVLALVVFVGLLFQDHGVFESLRKACSPLAFGVASLIAGILLRLRLATPQQSGR